MSDIIAISGAREHNLKGIDLEIPHDTLVVISGVSGSGKSSLAFDTLHREGQRRFLSSFPAFLLQDGGKLDQPEFESISGLRAAVAVGQAGAVRNPRSTVGTLSACYDELRLLFAKAGTADCLECKAPLGAGDSDAVIQAIHRRFLGGDVSLLVPIIESHRGGFRRELEVLLARGVRRVRIDGELRALSSLPPLKANERHTIEAELASQISMSEPNSQIDRLIEDALGRGLRAIIVLGDGREERFSTRASCSKCGAPAPPRGPRSFSFNSPFGACPECKGLGVCDEVYPQLLIADESKSIRQGALVPTTPGGYVVYSQVTIEALDRICHIHGFSVDTPFRELNSEQRKVIFHGSDRLKVPYGKHPLENRLKWKGITAKPREEGYYRGLIPVIQETLKRNRNRNILRFVRSAQCRACGGSRLRPEARAVRFEGWGLAELVAMPISSLRETMGSIDLSADLRPIASPLRDALSRRLDGLVELGLGHLHLQRSAPSLSEGEIRRLRLATLVESPLQGLLYVMDEASAGLHPSDRAQLRATLRRLRDRGNTVVAVEHDDAMIRSADLLIDIGPGAGRRGGRLQFLGPPRALIDSDPGVQSPTAAHLSGRETIPTPRLRRASSKGKLRVLGAAAHNLKNIDVEFPLGVLLGVTGRSGAGKSTLVNTIIARALRAKLHGATAPPGDHRELQGSSAISKLILVDQAPIGRTPRSNAATYSGVFDAIRSLFAKQPKALEAGLKPGSFSFNVKGGRCETCHGAGVETISMHGLGDLSLPCSDCDGRRFSREVLEVEYRGASILDVLEMSIEKARHLFEDQTSIRRILDALLSVGLGYLRLGQPATTLSGGEAQRVKLASELGRPQSPHTLYILDEATTGLHPADIKVLLGALNHLVDKGHSVFVVEHELQLIKCADTLIDLGPGAGPEGGRVVAQGTPEELARNPDSATGRALAKLFSATPFEPPSQSSNPHPSSSIELEGVSTHNLKNLSVTIPHRQMTVITGVSGSGKSSLAFGTLAAEARRLFAETLPAYQRRYLPRGSLGCLEQARGLTPTVAIRQSAPPQNPRSTVGCVSGAQEILRVLYSRAGTPFCPSCDRALSELRCPSCDFAMTVPITARLFSFNHHQGACPDCDGLAFLEVVDPARLITNPDRSIYEGAMAGHKTGRSYGDPHGQHLALLSAVEDALALDLHRPFRELDEEARRVLLHGSADRIYQATWRYQGRTRRGVQDFESPWKGFCGLIEEEWARKRGRRREALAGLMRQEPCPSCEGSGHRLEARAFRFLGSSIADFCGRPVLEALGLLRDWEHSPELGPRLARITSTLREGLRSRLVDLQSLGLSHLSLDRRLPTLSSGESQRLRLAAALDGGLTGISYVLDEPTSGLHPRDVEHLARLLRQLGDQGNTIVVVEHDRALLEAADHLIELGPGGGGKGGRIIAEGGLDTLLAAPESPTAKAWTLQTTLRSSPVSANRHIAVRGARAHNLRNIDIDIPQASMVAIAGVSGSGKTTLLREVLSASAQLGQAVECDSIEGLADFSSVVFVDRRPLSGSNASFPATWLGVFDRLRQLFAQSEEAKRRGFSKAHFSLGSRGGRCEECQGSGRSQLSLGGLAEVSIPCPLCLGQRYKDEIQSCLLRGTSLSEVLEMPAEIAGDFFAEDPKLSPAFEAMVELGLGYVEVGRPTSSLSGGEAQRLRLARELLVSGPEGSEARLYLLDEPCCGLHIQDVDRLLNLLRRFVAQGHSVLAVEHNLEFIARADHVIEVGPGGGPEGGQLLASCAPAGLLEVEGSPTGGALRKQLNR